MSTWQRRGFHSITPYLIAEDVGALVAFLEASFGAELTYKIDRSDGTIMHVELSVGDSMVMAGEPDGDVEPMQASIYLYVEDCDTTYARALEAGGTSVMEVTTMTHAGERYGGVKDPAGNIWWIATHLETIADDEAQRRATELGL